MGAAAGSAIMFFCFMVALVIVGVYVAAYGAHCLLVIVQGTAAGNDEIVWPDEPMLDWVRGSARLAFLLALCLAPAGLLSRALGPTWLPYALLLALVSLWLLFPFGLLSAMSANSPWVLFRPAVLMQLLRFAPAAFAFYLASTLVVLLGATPWYFALFAGQTWLLPVAACVSSACLFIYARLLGRLAWLLNRVEIPQARPAAAKPVRKTPRRPRGAEVSDPWAVPEPMTFDPPVELPVDGYEVAAPGAPVLEEPRPEKKQRRVKGYALRSEELPPTPAQSTTVGDHILQRHLAERSRASYVPPRPLLTGVYTFPWYPASVIPWLALSLGFTVVSGLLLAMGVFRPL